MLPVNGTEKTGQVMTKISLSREYEWLPNNMLPEMYKFNTQKLRYKENIKVNWKMNLGILF